MTPEETKTRLHRVVYDKVRKALPFEVVPKSSEDRLYVDYSDGLDKEDAAFVSMIMVGLAIEAGRVVRQHGSLRLRIQVSDPDLKYHRLGLRDLDGGSPAPVIDLLARDDTGFFYALNWLGSHPKALYEDLGEGGRFTADGDSLEVSTQLKEMMSRPLVQSYAAQLLALLRLLEIESVTLSGGDGARCTIHPNSCFMFQSPLPFTSSALEEQKEVELKLAVIDFDNLTLWVGVENNEEVEFLMQDEAFTERVNNREEAFSQSSVLRCSVIPVQGEPGLITPVKYIVTKVIEHRIASPTSELNVAW